MYMIFFSNNCWTWVFEDQTPSDLGVCVNCDIISPFRI